MFRRTPFGLMVLATALLCLRQAQAEPPAAAAPGGSASEPPAFDEETWVRTTNAWLDDVRARDAQARAARTPQVEAREAAFWARAVAMAQSVIVGIQFYGRVVDQHGAPVAGVEVEYDALGAYLASGTGTGRVHTDNDGRFAIVGARGKGLSISPLRKPGYEFRYPEGKGQNFANHENDNLGPELWRNTSAANPYPYRMWKIESADRVYRGEAVPGMVPDGRPYTLNLLGNASRLDARGLKTEGVTSHGDIIVSFEVTGDAWRATLRAIDGGLVENTDVYGNLAPEEGYLESLTFGATRAEGLQMTRRVYFRSRGGKVHGHMNLELNPYYSDRDHLAAIVLSYTTNPDGGRGLDGPKR